MTAAESNPGGSFAPTKVMRPLRCRISAFSSTQACHQARAALNLWLHEKEQERELGIAGRHLRHPTSFAMCRQLLGGHELPAVLAQFEAIAREAGAPAPLGMRRILAAEQGMAFG